MVTASVRKADGTQPRVGDGSYEAQNDQHVQILVQREWNSWRTAMVRLIDLEDVHWFQPPGAPRPLLHAYVCCTQIQSGDLSHDCRSTAPPHSLRVCVLKHHTPPHAFEALSRHADARRLERAGTRAGQVFAD